MNISSLYQAMALLFAALLAGFFARRWSIVDDQFMPNLSKFILNIAQPCMIVASVLNKEHLMSNLDVVVLILVGFGCYLLLVAGAFLTVKILHIKVDQGTYRFMFTFSNVGFMGYPVVESLFGGDALFNVTLFILVFQMVIYTIGAFFLSGDKKHITFSPKMFCKPSIIAVFLACIIYFTNFTAPQIFADCFDYVGDLTSPSSMILIGATLGLISFKDMLGTPKLYLMLAIKMILFPIMFYCILSPFLTNPLLLGIITVIMAMPVATNATMLSMVYGGNQKLASTGVLVSTVASMVTIPLLMQFLFG